MLPKLLCRRKLGRSWKNPSKCVNKVKIRLQSLRSDFEALKMKKFKSIVNQLKKYGDKIEDLCVVEKILCSLTLEFDCVVCVIEESKYLDSMVIEE